MKSFSIAILLGLTASLAGCADSVSKPVPVMALAPEQKTALKISGVATEAAPGVQMSQWDLDRISSRVVSELSTSGGVYVAQGNPDAATASKMKIVLTKYDSGNAFARAMFAGLGQIEIEANVVLLNSAGATVAEYKVSKDFAFGGIYGASTSIEDVEVGFAKSVAAIIADHKA